MFGHWSVRRACAVPGFGMFSCQNNSFLHTILKILSVRFLPAKNNFYRLPESFISCLTPQPALSVLFLRLFTFNPQSL